MPGSPPAAADILEVEILTLFGAQIGVNILHYNVRSVVAPAPTLQQIATAMDTTINVAYKALISSIATYRGIGVSNVTGIRSVQYVANLNAGGGTGNAQILPTQLRGLISWYGNLAGPRYRGRTYIAFPPTNGQDANGNPTVVYQGLALGLASILRGPWVVPNGGGNATLDLVIGHRTAGVWSGSDIVTGVARAKFATQRRSGAYGRVNTNPF